MFSNKNTAGKHLIVDIKNIKNTQLLNSSIMLKQLIENICSVCEYTVLNRALHNFIPIGCSILFLLGESHISIHTFPEKNYISFDLYSCRQYADNTEYELIFNYLLTELEADGTYKIVDRYFN